MKKEKMGKLSVVTLALLTVLIFSGLVHGETYDEGFAAGKQFCRENPAACNLASRSAGEKSSSETDRIVSIASDRSMDIPCADFQGTRYEFSLAWYKNPQDLSGHYWKLEPASVKTGCRESDKETPAPVETGIRVPAEWETHAATWMQWPNRYEANMRTAFADIIDVVQDYEPLHLLTGSASEEAEARRFLSQQGVADTNITWHVVPVDNAWMRDNGPIYVTDGTKTWIQNWKFNGWGGNFGLDTEYGNDDLIPAHVGQYLGMTVENRLDYVLEKGNLEFNGTGTLVLNRDCQDNRNPGMSKAGHEAILKEAFGVDKIIWAQGHDPEDGTTGHIDGSARFVNENTIAVVDFESGVQLDLLARACMEAGLNVVRYPGDPNWLVGNGFVVAKGEGGAYDAELKSQLQALFPDRDIHLIDAAAISSAGGGIHCVTNDQPAVN